MHLSTFFFFNIFFCQTVSNEVNTKMQLSTQCRTCGTINISKYVNNFLSTNPTTFTICSPISEFRQRQTSTSLPLPNPLPPHTRRYQSGQLVYVPSTRVCFKSQRSRVRYPVRPHTFLSPSADSSRAVVSFWRKYVNKVLVNRLGGLSLPRKSVSKLTDRPDMTIDVYHGRKTTTKPSPQTKILS